MSLIATKEEILAKLLPDMNHELTTSMHEDFGYSDLKTFVRHANRSVDPHGKVDLTVSVCEYYARRLVLWRIHYNIHPSETCDMCKLIAQVSDLLIIFFNNPQDAKILMGRFFK